MPPYTDITNMTPSEYGRSIVIPDDDGWSSQNVKKPVRTISVTFEGDLDADYEYIKEFLATGLTREILESNLIKVTKSNSLKSMNYVYHGSIKVVDTQFKEIVEQERVFKVNGVTFTEEELILAVKKKYPDRLI